MGGLKCSVCYDMVGIIFKCLFIGGVCLGEVVDKCLFLIDVKL